MRSWFSKNVLRRRANKESASSLQAGCPTRPSSPTLSEESSEPIPTHHIEVAAAGNTDMSSGAADKRSQVHCNATVQEVLLALETLLLEASLPTPLPIKSHDRRLPSGERGVSLAFLAAISLFYERHGGLSLTMGDVCKGAGEHVTVCTLTLSTGLSLAESVRSNQGSGS